MSNVKIKTLSSVHIGNGDFLQQNTDFILVTEGEDEYLYVVDPKKILAFIGEENLGNWMLAIERKENTKDFVSRYAKNAKPEDYADRKILNFATLKETDTLKECIHNGMGLPYIPGSSIKGAIRTAVLAHYTDQVNEKEDKITIKDFRGVIKKVTARQVEEELFGKDPNNDVFRFIQVGDAYFKKNSEISTKLINLNITHRDTLVDEKKAQVIEAISPEQEAMFQMKINENYYKWAKEHDKQNTIGLLRDGMLSLQKLFKLVNQYTKNLVEDEINSWKDINITGAEKYIKNMNFILNDITSCKDNECVIRIGHASGWRFITGSWPQNLDNFYDVIVPASRPKNDNYKEYVFPKSRRLDTDGDILGFVKLEIQ